MAREVIFLPPGAGRSYDAGGMRGTFKADGSESDGKHCFTEWELAAGEAGPPPHLHREHEEAFFVTDGTVMFQAGDHSYEAPAGSFILIPAGITHKFSNPTDRPARCVNVWLPGGFEPYFERLTRLMSSDEPLDPEAVVELSAEYDVNFPSA
jgi:mannose-6-phosphate isomerase-like protein (cupin superfamily)